MGLVEWLQRLSKPAPADPPQSPRVSSGPAQKSVEPSEYESVYLHSSRWDELLAPSASLPNLRLTGYKGELWLTEITTGKFVAVGNRHLAKLGIWTANVRGIDYHTADVRATDTTPGNTLAIAREPENPHDRNAVAVLAEGRLLGYFDKQMAANLAKLIDAGATLEAISLAGSRRGKNDSRIQVLAADPALVRHLTSARR